MKRRLSISITFITLLSLLSCEKSVTIGGYVVSQIGQQDSISGITIGLFRPMDGYNIITHNKWENLELISSATTNDLGFFSMEIDEDMDLQNTYYFPVCPTDTLTANAKFTPEGSRDLSQYSRYGINSLLKLKPAGRVDFLLLNFDANHIIIKYDNTNAHFYWPFNTSYAKELIPGKNYSFKIFSIRNETEEFLGTIEKYIKVLPPIDNSEVDWKSPIQLIEIDYLTLHK